MSILRWIQAYGRLKDRNVEGAGEMLSRCIKRLKKQNPFMLQVPDWKPPQRREDR